MTKLLAAYLVMGLCWAIGFIFLCMNILYALDGHPLGIAVVAVVAVILIWDAHRWATKTIRRSRKPPPGSFADSLSHKFRPTPGDTVTFKRPIPYFKPEPEEKMDAQCCAVCGLAPLGFCPVANCPREVTA